jgi:hypothetical protein
MVALVFLLNLMEELLEFMDWLDHEQYLSKQDLMIFAS